MSVSSLRQVISGSFVSKLAKIGQATSAGQDAANVALGQKAATIDVTLRTGAKNFAQGLQALNVAASYINVSRETNEHLLGIVDKLDILVTKASKGGGGAQGGDLSKLEFQSLARDFRKILKESKIRGEDVLDQSDLSSVLVRAGLDPEKADSVSTALKGFSTLSSPQAADSSAEAVNVPATRIPVEEFVQGLREVAGTFDEAVEGGESPDTVSAFKAVRTQLAKVRTTLRGNISALNNTAEVIGKNITLTRATGLALLDMSNTVKSDADPQAVADELQQRIRSNATQALSQAENLQAILVAGATLSSNTFSSK